MNRTITAKEFLARDYAGLVLVGFDAEGYQWEGDERAWEVAAINDADDDFPGDSLIKRVLNGYRPF